MLITSSLQEQQDWAKNTRKKITINATLACIKDENFP